MGMTDKQFNAFIRLLLELLKEANTESDEQKKTERLEKIIDIVNQLEKRKKETRKNVSWQGGGRRNIPIFQGRQRSHEAF